MIVRGYVTSRSFAGLCLPVPAQNACLREYSKSINATYILPPLEHVFDNCFMQLFTVLEDASKHDQVAMYSVAMMPYSKKKLINIFKLSNSKEISFYFLLESTKVESIEELNKLQSSYQLKKILDNQPQPSIRLIKSLI